MKLAYFWLTPQGKQLAERLQVQLGGTVEPKEHFAETVERDFAAYDGLIFIMATGIVVRTIASLVQSKASDPAVLVLDQQGKHVISLLSGHLGGANDLTREIAAAIGADPVITTATDVQGVTAFDEIAKRNDLVIENLGTLKYISGALLEGKNVTLCTKLPLSKPCGLPQIRVTDQPEGEFRVVISDRLLSDTQGAKTLYLRPKSLVIGVGCKRNTEPAHLAACFREFLETYQLSALSVAKLATIGLKQQETAILQLCEELDVPLEIVSDESIQNCPYPFETSAFVQSVTGVPSVSEACSYLASGCGEVLTGKVKYTGVTLAACRRVLLPLKLEE